jgi:leader peptidase (prepilin peptidase) / N-methyltransferase
VRSDYEQALSKLSRPRAWRAEALAVTGALAAVVCNIIVLPRSEALFGGLLAVFMIAIAYVDRKSFTIPDGLNLCAIACGIGYYLWVGPNLTASEWGAALFRGAIASIALLSIRLLYTFFRGREGLGLGDVKLAFVAGVWLEWSWLPACLEIATLSALAVYVYREAVQAERFDLNARVPFGLFFAPAIWISWVFMMSGSL